jgi:hypothetical protein
MLNKDICMKCINSMYHDIRWSMQDDRRWQDGHVLCPPIENAAGENYTWIRTPLQSINKNCPYKLEQAVAAGMSHVK